MAISKAELTKLTPAEFAKLQQAMAEVADDKAKELKQEARQEIDRILAKYGFAITDLYRFKAKSGDKKATDPKDFAYFKEGIGGWVGKGRVPFWLVEEINNGTDPKKYLVKGKEHSTAVENLWKKKQKQKP